MNFSQMNTLMQPAPSLRNGTVPAAPEASFLPSSTAPPKATTVPGLAPQSSSALNFLQEKCYKAHL